MDRALVAPRGITPSGVAGALAPILVLLGSDRIPSYQVAALQLITVFLVQFLAIIYRTTGSEEKKRVATEPVRVVEIIREVPVLENARQAQPIQSHKEEVIHEPPQVLKSKINPDDLDVPVPPPVPAARSRAIQEHPMYSNQRIDSCLRHFLSVLDPTQLSHLPPMAESPAGQAAIPASVPLDSWEQLLNTPTTTVAKHPTIPHLYSISAVYPEVPLRNLWELLIDITGRPSWDTMCYATDEIEQIGMADQSEGATRQATISYLATKGMFPVKANDMVMLSVNARLSPERPLRLVCATTSVDHPSKPVSRSYTRMQLTVSGFIAEELPSGGTKVTQLTDLSALGSWVPGKIIKMVTESMIPKSLAKIGEVAKTRAFVEPRAILKGDSWLPPFIGSWDEPIPPTSSSTTLVNPSPSGSEVSVGRKRSSRPLVANSLAGTAEESDAEQGSSTDAEESTTSELAKLPASTARDMRELVLQLRTVNTRLSHLERLAGPSASSAASDASAGSITPNGQGHPHPPNGYRPPLTPFGVNKVTDSALSKNDGPLGWMSRLNVRSFVSGLGAGIFSTTTAATVAALVVFWLRKKKVIG